MRRTVSALISAGLCLAFSALSIASDKPFRFVKSFPVSEPTWGARAGGYYLVAAERSIQIFQKTGPGEADYARVNQIFLGPRTSIANAVIDGEFLYLGAGSEGLAAYRIADLGPAPLTPALLYRSDKSIGWISIAGGRVYASYGGGGIGVFDQGTLALLGEGLFDTHFGGVTADVSGAVYAQESFVYDKLVVIDARDPQALAISGKLQWTTYAMQFVFPGTIVGRTLYMAEFNAGVGVYDLSADPFNPALLWRAREYGALPGGRPGPSIPVIRGFAASGSTGFIVYQGKAESLSIGASSMTTLATLMDAPLVGGSLMSPTAIQVYDNVAAISTTMEGMRFYDVADPAAPQLLLNIDLPSRIEGLAKRGDMVYCTTDVDGVWQIRWDGAPEPRMSRRIPLKGLSEDLVLRGNFLYVANGIGLGVIDVSDETNPHEESYWDFPYPGLPDIGLGWVEGVDLDSTHLYAALGPAGMSVFSLADPAHPARLSTVVPGSWGNDVAVAPGRKLVSYTGSDKFALVDVTDPAAPVIRSNLPVPANAVSQGSVFSPDGRYLVLCQKNIISIYDTADPAAPVFIKSVPISGASEGALFYGGYLLVAGRGGGVDVFEVGATPADLVKVENVPCHFYNSKFFVEGSRVFTNSTGIDELELVPKTGVRNWTMW